MVMPHVGCARCLRNMVFFWGGGSHLAASYESYVQLNVSVA